MNALSTVAVFDGGDSSFSFAQLSVSFAGSCTPGEVCDAEGEGEAETGKKRGSKAERERERERKEQERRTGNQEKEKKGRETGKQAN